MPRKPYYTPVKHLQGKRSNTVCGRPGHRWPNAKVITTTDIKQVTCKKCLELRGIKRNASN